MAMSSLLVVLGGLNFPDLFGFASNIAAPGSMAILGFFTFQLYFTFTQNFIYPFLTSPIALKKLLSID